MRQVLRPLERFLQLESAGGIALFATAAMAMIWANSPWQGSYERLFQMAITLGAGNLRFTESLRLLINDGLMALFFLVVGLEIKRELTAGELNSVRKAALPVAGALGGMLVPALIFVGINLNSGYLRGWAIPTATDIAFAMGIMRLLGSRIPKSVVVFLTALAIVDDIGAVIIIAFFYTANLNIYALLAALMVLGCLFLMNRFKISSLPVYFIAGFVLWIALFESGVHPTIAGVLVGLVIPDKHRNPRKEAPLHKAETALLPWVNFLIMPLFALANAGVTIDLQLLQGVLSHPLAVGVIIGLFAGKQIGISLFSYLAVKLKVASLPRGANWKQIHGAAIAGGIGFTMSLFIADLALPNGEAMSLAKLAIIIGSLVSGSVATGYIFLTNRGKGAESNSAH